MASDEILYEDEWTVAALVVRGECLVRDYLQGLPSSTQSKVLALIRRYAEYGPPRNPERNKKITDVLWELKSFQARLLYFFDGQKRIVITHGFTKKRDDIPKAEIEKALRLRDQYLNPGRR